MLKITYCQTITLCNIWLCICWRSERRDQ